MAHVPDGFLSPAVLAGTAAASAVALSWAARRTRTLLLDRELPLLGALTAFVFAAQMLNFPLAAGASAHLLGGVLVAVLAGPAVGMLVIFAVVLVQALLFQDGGIAALGANTLNLAVLGAGGGWLVYRWALALTGVRGVAVAVGAFGSAVLTGVAVSLELAWSGAVGMRTALLVVGGAHLVIGIAEAALTVALLSLVWRSRPELLPALPTERRWAIGVTAAAGVLAVAAGYLASARPDVLESAAERFGLHEVSGYSPPLPGYESALAALTGLLAVFLLAWLLLRALARR